MANVAGDASLLVDADTSKFTAKMEGAAKSVDKFVDKAEQIGPTVSRSSDQATTATAELDRQQQRLVDTINRYQVTMGKTRGEILEYRAAQLGITDQVQSQITAIKAHEAAMKAQDTALRTSGTQLNKYGVSVGQTNAALRQLPAQLSDVVVSLQGGQRPLSVLLQQGSQVKDSFGGIAPAANAVVGAISKLITPLTLGAGAVAALTVAYFQGASEAENYAKALTLTGNIAGKTISDLQNTAKQIAEVTGTQGQAAEALAAAIQSGKIAPDALKEVGAAAVTMSRVLGKSVDESVASFVKLADEPAKASAKLNETMHYLTLATYERIKALEDQGRTEEAIALAQRTAADVTTSRLKDVESQVGVLQRAWQMMAADAKKAWDIMMGIGRPISSADALDAAQKRLADLRARGPMNNFETGRADYADQLRNAESDVRGLRFKVLNEQLDAFTKSTVQARNDAAITAADAVKKWQDQAKGVSAVNRELKRYNDWLDDIRKVNPKSDYLSPANVAAGEAAIRKQFASTGGTGRADMLAGTKLALEQIKAQSEAVTTANANTERVLEAQRAAGLVSESAYYAEKRRLIDANTKAQIDALNAENDRLRQDKLKTSDSLERDRKVAENVARINKLQADGTTALTVLDIQQAAAARERAASLLTAQQAAKDYLDTTQRAYDRELQGVGAGPNRRNYLAGVSQIEDRYESERRRLQNNLQLLALQGDGKLNPEIKKNADDQLKIINDTQAKSLASWESHYAALRKMDGDWSKGVSEGLRSYYDDASNFAKDAAGATTNALKGLEDQFTNLITKGKFDVNAFLSSITEEAARITVRQGITGPLSDLLSRALPQTKSSASDAKVSTSKIEDGIISALTSSSGTVSAANASMASSATAASTGLAAVAAAAQTASISLSTLGGGDALDSLLKSNNAFGTVGGGSFGGGGGWGQIVGSIFGSIFGGLFADGGNPPIGVPSIVGERGPELFVPKTAGTIIPNEALGSGGGPITIVNQTTGRIDSVQERRLPSGERQLIIQETMERTVAALNDPNSKMSKTLGRNYNTQRVR